MSNVAAAMSPPGDDPHLGDRFGVAKTTGGSLAGDMEKAMTEADCHMQAKLNCHEAEIRALKAELEFTKAQLAEAEQASFPQDTLAQAHTFAQQAGKTKALSERSTAAARIAKHMLLRRQRKDASIVRVAHQARFKALHDKHASEKAKQKELTRERRRHREEKSAAKVIQKHYRRKQLLNQLRDDTRRMVELEQTKKAKEAAEKQRVIDAHIESVEAIEAARAEEKQRLEDELQEKQAEVAARVIQRFFTTRMLRKGLKGDATVYRELFNTTAAKEAALREKLLRRQRSAHRQDVRARQLQEAEAKRQREKEVADEKQLSMRLRAKEKAQEKKAFEAERRMATQEGAARTIQKHFLRKRLSARLRDDTKHMVTLKKRQHAAARENEAAWQRKHATDVAKSQAVAQQAASELNLVESLAKDMEKEIENKTRLLAAANDRIAELTAKLEPFAALEQENASLTQDLDKANTLNGNLSKQLAHQQVVEADLWGRVQKSQETVQKSQDDMQQHGAAIRLQRAAHRWRNRRDMRTVMRVATEARRATAEFWASGDGANAALAELQQLALVLHPFEAREGDDLALQPGQLIVLKNCPGAKNWWRGTLLADRSKTGVFPKNRVQVLPKPDMPVAGSMASGGVLGMFGRALFGGSPASSPHDSPTRDRESTNPVVLADGFDSVHDESDVRSVNSDDTDVSMHSAVGQGNEPLTSITVEFRQPAPLGIVWSMHAVGGFLQMSIHALSPEFPAERQHEIKEGMVLLAVTAGDRSVRLDRMGAAEAEVMMGSLLKERPLQLTLAHLASARLSLDEPLGVQPARP